jgi:hypothetical protein
MDSQYIRLLNAPAGVGLSAAQLERIVGACSLPSNSNDQWLWEWNAKSRSLLLVRKSLPRTPIYKVRLDERLNSIEEVLVLSDRTLYSRPKSEIHEVAVLKWLLIAGVLGDELPFPQPDN